MTDIAADGATRDYERLWRKELGPMIKTSLANRPGVREIIRRRIGENRRVLGELMALQLCKESAAARWEEMPDGHFIESLIDAGDLESLKNPGARKS
ncbi:MAG: hypothetical protein ACOY4D_07090 [Pseudomonadota bacterium]